MISKSDLQKLALSYKKEEEKIQKEYLEGHYGKMLAEDLVLLEQPDWVDRLYRKYVLKAS